MLNCFAESLQNHKLRVHNLSKDLQNFYNENAFRKIIAKLISLSEGKVSASQFNKF